MEPRHSPPQREGEPELLELADTADAERVYRSAWLELGPQLLEKHERKWGTDIVAAPVAELCAELCESGRLSSPVANLPPAELIELLAMDAGLRRGQDYEIFDLSWIVLRDSSRMRALALQPAHAKLEAYGASGKARPQPPPQPPKRPATVPSLPAWPAPPPPAPAAPAAPPALRAVSVGGVSVVVAVSVGGESRPSRASPRTKRAHGTQLA